AARRGARRSRAGSDRCPGTRRAAGACSRGGVPPARRVACAAGRGRARGGRGTPAGRSRAAAARRRAGTCRSRRRRRRAGRPGGGGGGGVGGGGGGVGGVGRPLGPAVETSLALARAAPVHLVADLTRLDLLEQSGDLEVVRLLELVGDVGDLDEPPLDAIA